LPVRSTPSIALRISAILSTGTWSASIGLELAAQRLQLACRLGRCDLIDRVAGGVEIRPQVGDRAQQRHLLLLAGRRIGGDRAGQPVDEAGGLAGRGGEERDRLSPAVGQRHRVGRRLIEVVDHRIDRRDRVPQAGCRRVVADDRPQIAETRP
jgi:hypothetical protein